MRGDPPRLPARPAASSGASATSAEEVRPLPGDPAARRRDEASGRRQASASRLMGAVTRHLLDDVEEERVTGESSRDMGSGSASTSSATGAEGAGKSAGKSSARVATGAKGKAPPRGTPDPVTRRGAASARRSAPPEDDVWAQGVDAADGAGRIVGPESRIQPGRSAARIEGVRPEASERVGRSPRMRIASWGAVLAAVAALVVIIAAGWLDVGPADSANASGTDGAAPREPAPGR
ncbi:hypothetical protein ACQ86G_22235 [Roseateles chitinivorans]|uniref:hypothetical protein n=1 Tax=Roseateles chitinivorans TaxID=2917965 RepID=UPI003D6753BC